MMLAQNRNESDQTLQATLRGFQSTASSNGGKWGSGRGAKKVSMDDGDSDIGETSGAGYFSGIHSTAYLHDPPVRLHPSHRHTASAYTAATFTASPRGSQDGGEVGNVVGGRPLTMIETSSSYRQMAFGPLDRSPGPSTRDP